MADLDATPLVRLFSARHEFPDEWHRFLHPAGSAHPPMLECALTPERFPFLVRTKQILITAVHVFLKPRDGFVYDDSQAFEFDLVKVVSPNDTAIIASAQALKMSGSPVAGVPHREVLQGGTQDPGTWRLTVSQTGTAYPDGVEDLWMVIRYSAQ